MLNLFFYVLSSIVIGILIGCFLPRIAIIIGFILLVLGLLAMGSCVYQEFIITKPHDTSAYGMMATISCLTIVPLGIALVVTGARRR